MSNEQRKIEITSLSGVVAFFLAIAPVLDPYIVVEIGTGFTLKINDVFMLLLTVLCFSRSTWFSYRTGFLCYWLLGLSFIGIIGNLGSSTNFGNSAKIVIVWFVFAICLSYIWKTECREKYFQWIQIIALIAAILVIIQFIAGNLNIPMWDGRIPGLGLGKYDGWAGYIDHNTGNIRPNGLFQEASYLGIFLAIAFAQAFKEEKIRHLIIYAIAMLMTSSLVAILSLFVITLVMLFTSKKLNISSKTKRRILFTIIIAVFSIIYIGSTNATVGHTISYIMKRFTNLSTDLQGTRMSSSKYRILGHLDLFNQYSFFQKLFGVGIGQYSTLFNVKAYSNVWVTTVLNSGIIGVAYLIVNIFALVKRVRKENLIFLLIFIIVISFDYQWFSWYFIGLLSSCIIDSENNDNISNT